MFQIEKCIINKKLLHICRFVLGSQSMNAQKIVCEVDRVGYAVAVIRIIKPYLRNHVKINCVIDISV